MLTSLPAPLPPWQVQTSRPSQHVIDVENMLGGDITLPRLRAFLDAYSKHVPVSSNDDVIIGAGPKVARIIAFDLPRGVRLKVGFPGFDSADLALLDSLDATFSANHFERVFMASGDHFFAPFVQRVRELGTDSVAVIGEGIASMAMIRATSCRVRLDIAAAVKGCPETGCTFVAGRTETVARITEIGAAARLGVAA